MYRKKRTNAKRFRPRITSDTVTIIVYLSLTFCTCIVVWGMIQAQFGVDSSAIVDSALNVFGKELGICGLLTIHSRWVELQDRKAEERRMRREEGMKRNVKRNKESDITEPFDS